MAFSPWVELNREALSFKPRMGVARFLCKETGECFLVAAPNVEARANRVRLQVETGTMRNKRFEELWRRCGEEGSEVSVAEELEYVDGVEHYADELDILLQAFLERDGGAQRL
ncbi:MAG: GIY-YIG nuclease family protein [Berryella intestinalis]|uniref:GIY-YIG nuclease family protein n=1 Tax=Berryella intestinalis TaxID=1531429 RepID=UPI002A542C8A|nr:GIY-YIG nuclease family protein [Berryella intestinalis]MDD7368916.1 GIY-YIG nuclease family protein [Berryella intestinalis]MDY3128454.1 GIY-YIG nuclease family protein [Berryella intestinalis]